MSSVFFDGSVCQSSLETSPSLAEPPLNGMSASEKWSTLLQRYSRFTLSEGTPFLCSTLDLHSAPLFPTLNSGERSDSVDYIGTSVFNYKVGQDSDTLA